MHMKVCIQEQYSTTCHEYNICRTFCKITAQGILDYSVQLISHNKRSILVYLTLNTGNPKTQCCDTRAYWLVANCQNNRANNFSVFKRIFKD